MDICHDCFAIPGRALMSDATDAARREKGHSLFSALQSVGRLSGLLAGVSASAAPHACPA
jgi:hypothetical protein